MTVLDRMPVTGDPAVVADERRPDPEVPERARRRRFTAQYKLDVLAAALSKSTVSRVCQAIGEQFEAWHTRPLEGVLLDYLFLDGSMFKMHPGAPGRCSPRGHRHRRQAGVRRPGPQVAPSPPTTGGNFLDEDLGRLTPAALQAARSA